MVRFVSTKRKLRSDVVSEIVQSEDCVALLVCCFWLGQTPESDAPCSNLALGLTSL